MKGGREEVRKEIMKEGRKGKWWAKRKTKGSARWMDTRKEGQDPGRKELSKTYGGYVGECGRHQYPGMEGKCVFCVFQFLPPEFRRPRPFSV